VFGRHVAELRRRRRRRRRRCRAYEPTSNTASHDNHEKIQPRSQGLSSSRRETLVWAGHVSMYTNEIPIGGGSLTYFVNTVYGGESCADVIS